MKRIIFNSQLSSTALVLTVSLLLIVLSNRSSASQPAGLAMDNGTAAANSSDAGTEIKIDNFAFMPEAVTFRSGALDTDDHFQFRFTEPGEYQFFCRMHPKMTGKIIVRP
jgi:plastocyanin